MTTSRADLGGVIYFGIDSMVPEVKAQIEALRDSGNIVHLYGTLLRMCPTSTVAGPGGADRG